MWRAAAGIIVLAVGVGTLFFSVSGAALTAEQTGESSPAAGRYQLTVAFDGRIYVIDTATGETWSRQPGIAVAWQSLGNPTAPQDGNRIEAVNRSVDVELPDSEIAFTIRQRQEKEVPGTDGKLSVRLSDITGDVVLITLKTSDGYPVIDDKPMRQGDTVTFKSAKKTYRLYLEDLENVLVGDDFAEIRILPDDGEVKSSE